MKACRICGRTDYIFDIELTADAGEQYSLAICDDCYTLVAQIAKNATANNFLKLKEILDEKIEALSARLAALEGGE